MYQGKTFLAIIPARSGSKRLPNKNIKNLCGKPLIAWSIEAGLQSKYIDGIVVSTDSQEYAEIAEQYGAKVPCIRPLELSKDTSTTFDSIKHMIDFYKEKYKQVFDYIVLLQPTSPLRTPQHIDEAIELLIQKQANSVISVCKCEHSPLWCNTLPKDKNMDNFLSSEILNLRSQELPAYYRLNGAIYIAKTSSLLGYQSFFTDKGFAYEMSQKHSTDIDTQFDFDFCEFLLQGISR
ncbi:cytidylyltransferase domain-containing protein [Helicobacter brantae]|uniref:CMP-N-acetlyneuraminic acid synthetase n=1 Tax=Helicobacter brantae TaxID=375927 RepID=A0A3D8J4I2_9HELI|nr:acylneuraminate cytidylyltransferase family protein [Helicobacter brantae]RDU72140.1 CMP-N-acetlyneuraminic acid synthetase [Helicobacter brantae]